MYKVRSDVEKMAPVILDVMKITELHGILCWLNYGALLGMVRENRLLPWNNDAELSCWYDTGVSNKFKLITDDLNKKGYHAYYYSTRGAISVKIKGVNVNINCYWLEGKDAVRPHEKPSEQGYAHYLSSVFYWIGTFIGAYPSGFLGRNKIPLSINETLKIILISLFRLIPVKFRKTIFLKLIKHSINFGYVFQKTAIPAIYFEKHVLSEFYGEQVYIPENSKQLLRFIYGKEWKIPKENWSFYNDKYKSYTSIKFIDTVWDYNKMDII